MLYCYTNTSIHSYDLVRTLEIFCFAIDFLYIISWLSISVAKLCSNGAFE